MYENADFYIGFIGLLWVVVVAAVIAAVVVVAAVDVIVGFVFFF